MQYLVAKAAQACFQKKPAGQAHTLQENLLIRILDVLDDDGGAEWVDDVGVVRVQDQRMLNLACKCDSSHLYHCRSAAKV